MGFFSFTCAKTGLPVMAGEACRLPSELGMCNVVAVYSNGERFEGVYDGYGRVDGEQVYDEIGRGTLKLVLKQFYNPAVAFDALGKCRGDPGQGYFHDWEFIRAAYGRTAAAHRYADDPLFAFDSTQYLHRYDERVALATKQDEFMRDWTGVAGSVRDAITRCMEECLRDREGDTERLAARYTATWQEAVALMPGWLREMPPMAGTALFERVNEALSETVRNETITAWAANRPAREPNFERLLAMDLVNGWSDRCVASRETAR